MGRASMALQVCQSRFPLREEGCRLNIGLNDYGHWHSARLLVNEPLRASSIKMFVFFIVVAAFKFLDMSWTNKSDSSLSMTDSDSESLESFQSLTRKICKLK